MNTHTRSMIERAAQAQSLDPRLVEAVILKESSGHAYAWNPEPAYKYLWNVAINRPFRQLTMAERVSETPPADFPFLAGDRDQEWWAQQASWGWMQVMGAFARELGFRGPYLTELCDPQTNLLYGCRALAGLMRWSDGDVRKALAGYNGGRGGYANAAPAAYARAVYRSYEQLKADRA